MSRVEHTELAARLRALSKSIATTPVGAIRNQLPPVLVEAAEFVTALSSDSAPVRGNFEAGLKYRTLRKSFLDRRGEVKELTGELKKADKRIARLEAALTKCAKWFKDYGDGHQAKGNTDKAQRNYDREAACNTALEGRTP